MSDSEEEERVNSSEEQEEAAFDGDDGQDQDVSDQQDDQPADEDGDDDDEGHEGTGDGNEPGKEAGSDRDEANRGSSEAEPGERSDKDEEAGEDARASDYDDYDQGGSGGNKGDGQDDASDEERRNVEDHDGVNADDSGADDDYTGQDKPVTKKLKRLKKKTDKPKEKGKKDEGKEKKKKKKKQKGQGEEGDNGDGERKRKGTSKSSRKAKDADAKSKPKRSRAQAGGKVEKKQSMFARINSEDDEEGDARPEDRSFIDDRGARKESSDESGSEDEGRKRARAMPPEAVEALSFFERKKRKVEFSREDMEAEAETLLRKMDMAVEDDVAANRRGEPALKKVMLLPEAVAMLQKKPYKEVFLEKDVLKVLRNWLEPMEDGSLPNIQIRAAILRILKDMNLDTLDESHKNHMKDSGIGKVVMFLSRCDQETALNKKVAKSIIEDWSRPIIGASTRYEDAAPNADGEDRGGQKQWLRNRTADTRSPGAPSDAADAAKGVDSELDAQGQLMSRKEAARLHARIPEMSRMDFKIRPRSLVEEKERKVSDKHTKMAKTIQKLRAPKKAQRAIKPSIEGRGLVKTR